MSADYLKHNTFGDRLAIAIQVSGLSQIELSGRTRIPQSQLSHYVSGRRQPSLDNLAKMIPQLRVDCGWLVCGTYDLSRPVDSRKAKP